MSQPGGRGAVTIFGDGSSTRDFVYIDDVVAANLAAASAPFVSGCAFNIGAGQAQSIDEVADEIARLTVFDGHVVYAPARPGDIRHSVADIRLARKGLGFVPATDFTNGLRATHAWWCGSRKGQGRAVVEMFGPVVDRSLFAAIEREVA